ncbi:MAG: hypothetical protein ACR2LS_02655 [Thermomicrobiales bacterium]
MMRVVIVLLLAVQIGLIALAASHVWANPPLPANPADMTLAGSIVPDSAGTLESGLRLARDRALGWDADAELVLVSEQIDWPFEPPAPGAVSIPPGGWLTYVFANDSGDALSLELQRLTGTISRAVETIWPDRNAAAILPLGDLPISSDTAILTVEELSGRDFRAQCPASRYLSFVTLIRAPAEATPVAAATPISGPPASPAASDWTWLVTYADRGADDDIALIAAVDANTGDVIRVENDLDSGATPCGL